MAFWFLYPSGPWLRSGLLPLFFYAGDAWLGEVNKLSDSAVLCVMTPVVNVSLKRLIELITLWEAQERTMPPTHPHAAAGSWMPTVTMFPLSPQAWPLCLSHCLHSPEEHAVLFCFCFVDKVKWPQQAIFPSIPASHWEKLDGLAERSGFLFNWQFLPCRVHSGVSPELQL